MRIGNDANCHATSCCSALPGSSPRRDNMARCMPASWACAYVRERGGCMVRNIWWHLGPALDQRLPSALHVWDPMDGVPQLLFSFDVFAARSILECLCADWSPKNLHPLWAPDLRREVSHSWGALSCLVPHPRFSNVESNPRSLQGLLSQQVMDCSCAFGHCRPRTRHRGTRRSAPLARGVASLRTRSCALRG